MTDTFTPEAPTGSPASGVAGVTEDNKALDQAEQTAASATADESDADDDHGDEQPTRQSRAERRISHLAARAQNAERTAAEAMQIIRQMAAGQQQQQPMQQAGQATTHSAGPQLPPDLAQFVGPPPDPLKFPAGEFDPEYSKSVREYDRRLVRAEIAMEQRQGQVRQAQSQFQQRMQGIIERGSEKYEDFADKALSQSVPITEPVLMAITRTDAPEDVAYWLGNNPKEAARIAALRDPVAVAREIGRIEARLEAVAKAPPVQQTSAPPPPPRAVRGGGSAAPDLSSMSADQFAALRNQQEYGKR